MRCSDRSVSPYCRTPGSHIVSSPLLEIMWGWGSVTTSHHRDRHRRGIRPTNCLYIVTFWLVTNLPHDMMTQDPGCGHGDSFTLPHQSHTCHNWAAARRWPGDWWRPANCYFDAARYKGNTQHSTPQSCKEYFPLGGCRARAVARFGGVTPQCLWSARGSALWAWMVVFSKSVVLTLRR